MLIITSREPQRKPQQSKMPSRPDASQWDQDLEEVRQMIIDQGTGRVVLQEPHGNQLHHQSASYKPDMYQTGPTANAFSGAEADDEPSDDSQEDYEDPGDFHFVGGHSPDRVSPFLDSESEKKVETLDLDHGNDPHQEVVLDVASDSETGTVASSGHEATFEREDEPAREHSQEPLTEVCSNDNQEEVDLEQGLNKDSCCRSRRRSASGTSDTSLVSRPSSASRTLCGTTS